MELSIKLFSAYYNGVYLNVLGATMEEAKEKAAELALKALQESSD